MKKITAALMGIAVVLAAFSFTACSGTKQMTDDFLQNVVNDMDGNYNAYRLEIVSFDVNDRNYDKKYKTESVTVSVTAENEESTYQASYSIVGQYGDKGMYGDKHWVVADRGQNYADVTPKFSLPQSMLEEVAASLLDRSENKKHLITRLTALDYSTSLKNHIDAEIELSSEAPYINATAVYREVPFSYSLDGWKLDVDLNSLTCERNIQLKDDLCGTWLYTDKDGDTYGFVIDKVDGLTISIKCYADSDDDGWRAYALKQFSNKSPVQVTLQEDGQDSSRLVGTVVDDTVSREEKDYIWGTGAVMRTLHSDRKVDIWFYPQRNGEFSNTLIYGDEYLRGTSGTCMMMCIYSGEYRNMFDAGYVLTKQ